MYLCQANIQSSVSLIGKWLLNVEPYPSSKGHSGHDLNILGPRLEIYQSEVWNIEPHFMGETGLSYILCNLHSDKEQWT